MSTHHRRNGRRKVVMWPAIVIRGLERMPNTLIDISRSGAKVKAEKQGYVGEAVTVSCEHFAIEGLIVWRKDALAGIKFNHQAPGSFHFSPNCR